MNRRPFFEDQSTRLFDLRKIMIGVCITAAAYAILQVSGVHGTEVERATAPRRFCEKTLTQPHAFPMSHDFSRPMKITKKPGT